MNTHNHNHSHDEHLPKPAPCKHVHMAFNQKRLVWAIIITAITLLLEIAGGIYTNSLALLSDSAHMFSHLFSLGLSYVAIRLAQRPPTSQMTYGYYRMEILAAFVNGFTLFIIIAAILYGAFERFGNPIHIKAGDMLIVAVIGLIVNIITALLLHEGSRENINIKGAFFHSLGDLISSVGVVAAAIVIEFTGFVMLDILVSVLIAAIIAYWAVKLLIDSGYILLEGIPKELDLNEVKTTIKNLVETSTFVHHIHAWQIGTNIYALTAHVTIESCIDQEEITGYIQKIQKVLAEKFNIYHTTLQFETKPCLQKEYVCSNNS